MSVDLAPVSLDDKYTARHGRALMSGVQALVRLTLEQRRLDQERGLNTRVLVTGYQGSPLGTVDLEMARAARLLTEAGVVFQPGLNEELAATSVAGSQALDLAPGRRHDGVTGFWYGKNPGLDRAADAIRHGNLAGTAPFGGAVAWIGDDPSSKSSTVPSACEAMCQSLLMPVLAPGSVAEIIEFGLHAVALSRASGLWTGLKIVTEIADGSATVDLAHPPAGLELSGRTLPTTRPVLVGPASVAAEHDILTRRLDAAMDYAASARLNKITFTAHRARLGVLASGTTYGALLRALDDLGLDEPALNRLGLRLIRIGMPFPLAPERLVELTEGLDELLVAEDKTPFLENAIKAALYHRTGAPRVVGRHDETGRPLLTARGALNAEDIAVALAARIGADRLSASSAARLAALRPRRSRIELPTVPSRTPFFCSGCPHNASTRADDNTLVGVGIGCHVMVALAPAGRGRQLGLTQMGGEGAQWIGLAPFTADRHFVQNLGDGTFHHSGSLAIRAAVAAGVTMTYKLLYNDAVAMTGGQRAQGRLDVPALTRLLAIEGVRRVVITTAEPKGYRRLGLDPVASVRHRDELAEVERELAALDGVTVLIHDDRCAAEERRMRKRGLLPTPVEKVVINERVCEGCGDCGDVSTCLSVQPVDTEFGRKTRIHQASCNSDFSCLKGDCPSFLLVEPGPPAGPKPIPELPVVLTEPVARFDTDEVLIRMPGIGGTGVVTASQILQMAAHLDGRFAAGLDQTGLAQKGGPVVSDVRIGKRPLGGAVRATRGSADVLLGFDLLGAGAESNLAAAGPERTIAVLNTNIVPTAAMVTNQVALPGSPTDTIGRIEAVTRAADNLYLDAQRLSEALFGDHMPANMLLVGAAFQHGVIPLPVEAIEQAIRLNGAQVSNTLAAFRWGRAAALDMAAVLTATTTAEPPTVPEDPAAVEMVAGRVADPALAGALRTRVSDLVGYQSLDYAEGYLDDVVEVAELAVRRAGAQAGGRVALAYAVGLHRLMAYKDEYEVARLHLDATERARLRGRFGAGASVSVLLHPPLLRALGLNRKLRLRRSADLAFRILRAGRRLRGTPLDVFGYPALRRTERELVKEYRELVKGALAALHPANVEQVLALAELADTVRGYENVKLANVARFREQAGAALAALGAADQSAADQGGASAPPADRSAPLRRSAAR
ncbi:MAG TPA: indolepyruvate ferredoxin oxidoreductase family protein [Pseudonocardia sp.]